MGWGSKIDTKSCSGSRSWKNHYITAAAFCKGTGGFVPLWFKKSTTEPQRTAKTSWKISVAGNNARVGLEFAVVAEGDRLLDVDALDQSEPGGGFERDRLRDP